MREVCENRERYPIRNMFLYISGEGPLLPRCKPTSDLRLDAVHPTIEADQFTHEQYPERFKVTPIS
jgi:hypothetical protein